MIWQDEGYVVPTDAHDELMWLHLCEGEENQAHVEQLNEAELNFDTY